MASNSYIRGIVDNARKAAEAAADSERQAGFTELDYTKAQINPRFRTLMSEQDASAITGLRGQYERANLRGVGSGDASRNALKATTINQRTLASLRGEQQQAFDDVAQQRSAYEQTYQDALIQAKYDADAQYAELMLQDYYQRQMLAALASSGGGGSYSTRSSTGQNLTSRGYPSSTSAGSGTPTRNARLTSLGHRGSLG